MLPWRFPMIVVRDGSCSMRSCVSRNSRVTASDVATALAVYCSERTSRAYKDKFITFSDAPRLVDMHNLSTLCDKLALAYRESDCANTNVEAVFDLLLKVARKKGVKQEDIPSVLIISDMEFDNCAVGHFFEGEGYARADETLFKSIARRWEKYGYKMPHLAFWNVCSRTNGVPLQENDCGVTLVSGFSPNVMNMMTRGILDPYVAMVSVLEGERYKQITIA